MTTWCGEHRLVTEGLGVNHLRLVMGTSMGGMHTWMWGEMYPDFMDGLMPIASQPIADQRPQLDVAPHRASRRSATIPDWNDGNYEKNPTQ